MPITKHDLLDIPDADRQFLSSTATDWYSRQQETAQATAEPADESGDTSRGFKRAFAQVPELGYGAAALAAMSTENLFGEGGLSTNAKNYFAGKYAEKAAENRQFAPTVDFDTAVENAKAGDYSSLADWLQDTAGYVVGQGLQTVATFGAGALAGKVALTGATQKFLGGMVAKEASKLAAKGIAMPAATRAAASGIAANIAAGTALVGQNVGMEAGDIYGGLIEQSSKTGKEITGGDLARAWGMALAAAGTETATDLLGIGALTGKIKIPFVERSGIKGRLARGAVAGAIGAPVEGGQEWVQTYLEQIGAGKPTDTAEAQKERREALAVGAVGGTLMGGGAGALSRQSSMAKPQAEIQQAEITETDQKTQDAAMLAALGAEPSIAKPIDHEADAASILSKQSIDDAIAESTSGIDEFGALLKSEQIDVAFRRNQAIADATKAADYRRAIAQAAETQAEQADAMTRVQGFDEATPTAMQVAFQRAQEVPAQDVQQSQTEEADKEILSLTTSRRGSHVITGDADTIRAAEQSIRKSLPGVAIIPQRLPNGGYSLVVQKSANPEQVQAVLDTINQGTINVGLPTAPAEMAETPDHAEPDVRARGDGIPVGTGIGQAEPGRGVRIAEAPAPSGPKPVSVRAAGEPSKALVSQPLVADAASKGSASWLKEPISTLIRRKRIADQIGKRDALDKAVSKAKALMDGTGNTGYLWFVAKAKEFRKANDTETADILDGIAARMKAERKAAPEAAKNEEPRSTTPVAESQAPATSEPGYAGVAPGHEGAAPQQPIKPESEVFSIDAARRTLVDALAEMGFYIDSEKGSELSGSRYVYATAPNGDALRVRVSDHDLPPTYEAMNGAADIEIGPHDMGTYEEDAIVTIAKRYGVVAPQWAVDTVSRVEESRRVRRDAEAEQGRRYLSEQAAIAEWLRVNDPDYDSRSTNSKKRARQRAREALGLRGGTESPNQSRRTKGAGEVSEPINSNQIDKAVTPAEEAPKPEPHTEAITAIKQSDLSAGEKLSTITALNKGDIDPNDVRDVVGVKEEAKPETEPSKAKISDMGEKIGGARKDVWTSYKDKLADAGEVDIKAEPLSKSWPAPDYEAMLEAGADPWSIAFMHAARDEIPTKPSSPWKLSGWVEKVKTLREFATGLTDGTVSVEKARLAIANTQALSDIASRVDLYMAVGHSKSLRGIRMTAHGYSLYRGVEYNPAKVLWVVEQKAKATAFSNWPRELAIGDTKEEALAKFKERFSALDIDKPASKETKFEIYSARGEKGYRIGKKMGRNPILLTDSFATVKEAREYMREHQDELVKKLEDAKKIPNVRRDTNEPRVGEDMRDGQDVTPQMFMDAFGFSGVEFGNWVEQKKRQKDLNEAYDALMDMAAIIGVKPKALSLNGELGLAFGARGTGGIDPAKAHYEPGFVVINLTKKAGAGSLGHEWWHALDNYFSRMRGKKADYTTEALDVSLARRGSEFIANTAVRKEMIEAFGVVMRAIHSTALKARSAKLDAKRNKEYWTTGPEMSARAYESYLISKLQDQDASNDYLANIVDEKTWAAAEKIGFELDESYPYPTAGEVPAIRAAFDNFFQTIETKETDTGTALFSRSQGDDRGIDMRDAEATINRVSAGYKNLPPIVTLANPNSLKGSYDELHDYINKEGAANDVEAAFHDGKIYVFTDNISSAERLEHVLFNHELGHYGLRGVFGPDLDPLLDYIRSKSLKVQFEANKKKRQYSTRSMIEAVEEVIVDMNPADLAKLKGWQKVVLYVRDWLASHGFTEMANRINAALEKRLGSEQVADLMVADMVTRAREWARSGKQTRATRIYMGVTRLSDVPGVQFYSQLSKAVEQAPDRVFGTASQFKLWLLANAGKLGVKKDEIVWSGIEDFLDMQGKGKVSKADVVGFLSENGVKVEDVVLGDKKPEVVEENGKFLVKKADGEFLESEFGISRFEKREFAQQAARELTKNSPEIKFASYAPPGGIPGTYREILVTLPQKSKPRSFADWQKRMDAKYGVSANVLMTSEEMAEGNRLRNNYDSDNNDFKSSHFDQPNILVHLRTDEVIGADGKRYLRVVELQSDWGQQRKKEDAMRAKGVEDGGAGAPAGPFIGKTEAWVSLGIKRAIQHAVSSGVDGIVFATGQQNADLYDLSKSVDEVSASKEKNGEYSVAIKEKDQRTPRWIGNFKESELSEQVGKELAEKIIKDGGGRFTGLDLQVGGEGMRSFYDTIVPSVANDVLKKLGGGKVGVVELTIPVEMPSTSAGDLARADRLRATLAGQPLDRANQPGFLIPESLKAKVQTEGLPLFSKRGEDAMRKAPPKETRPQTAQRIWQDKFNRFRVLQDWLNEQGVNLSEEADVYLAETTMHGRIAARKQDFRERVMAPLIEKTQRAGIGLEEIGDFLKMQHAKEANERIRKIHQDETATAYGVTDEEAKAAMDEYRRRPDYNELKEISDEWRAVTGQSKEILLNAGIISDDMAKAWESSYELYVPVKGRETKQGVGKGLDVKGKQKRRMGHSLRDEAILENIWRDYERAVTLDEHNLVGKSLIQFALEAKNPDIVTVDKPVKRQVLRPGESKYVVTFNESDVAVFDNKNDAYRYVSEEVAKYGREKSEFDVVKTGDPARVIMQASPLLADNEANVYIGGHAVRVQINDEIAAREYKNMGVEHLGAILAAGRTANSWLSKAYTGWSPDFIFTNPIRDATQGAVTLTGNYGIEIAGKVFSNYPMAVKELVKHFRNPGSSEIVNDYRAHGGSTGAAYLSDIERIGEDMQAAYNEYAGVLDTYNRVYQQAIDGGKSKSTAASLAALKSGIAGFKEIPVIGHFIKLIERINSITENALRVATYQTLVENNLVSKKKAAAQAKNLMNFNRKGEMSNVAGAMYLFFNPNVQGTQVMYHALMGSEHKGQARALAGMMVLSAIALASLARGGGDDDEERWKNTPDYIKDGNLIFGFGDKQVMLPLPYGYRIFHTLGNVMSDYAHGEDGYKLGIRLATSAFQQFSPVGNPMEGEVAGFQLLPTLPKMALGPSVNENAFGREIMPKRYSEAKPDSQLMYRGTKGSLYSGIAEGMNEFTGGSRYERGLIDVSPETLKYWVRSLTGGAGQFAADAINTPVMISQGVPPKTRDLPIVRRFIRDAGNVSDIRNAFWERANEAKKAADAFAGARKAGDVASMKDIWNEDGELISLSRFANSLQDEIKAKRDMIDVVRNDEKLTLAQKHEQMKLLEAQESAIYQRFIKAFDKQAK